MNKSKSIAVIGGGFVGGHIIKRAVAEGHNIRLISRYPKTTIENVKIISEDITKGGRGLSDAFEGVEVVINAAGIIKEKGANTFEGVHHRGTSNIVEACIKSGVKKIIHISALGVGKSDITPYFTTKRKGEQEIESSGLDYVIFRPSIIFGPGDGFVNMLAGIIKRFPIMPIFGDGLYRLQPISIFDLVDAILLSINSGPWDNRIYETCGSRKMTYLDIVHSIASVLNKRVVIIKIPFKLALFSLKTVERIKIPLPLTSYQLLMLKNESVCRENNFITDFPIEPLDFISGIGLYLK